ncbi:protein artemis-like [Arctopsyche grandis]|uniref:protein artemis-like n=1 Tax=Arctopsyche grandis TaxID=121162 RepID=UPI00406D72B0
MSTFEGKLLEIDGISVDEFTGKNITSRAFFLSHCHTDHMNGLNIVSNHLNNDSFIYMSPISAIIIKRTYPELKNFIRQLAVDETHLIRIPNDEVSYKCVAVTLIPAGHCPGSVMFLFEKCDGIRILYTADFRMTVSTLQKITHFHNDDGSTKTIHKMYFDSTFWNEDYTNFPSRSESSDYICSIIEEWISKGKEYFVSLSISAKYGSEYLYKEMYERLKMPIHVSNFMYDIYSQVLDMRPTVTNDPKKTQIHSCSTNYSCYAHNIYCLDNIKQANVRHVRPSAQIWNGWDEKSDLFKEKNDENFINVCYSSHCSHNELKEFLSYLKPKCIEPCVVPKDNPHQFYQSINEYAKDFIESPCIYEKKNLKLNVNETESLCDSKNIFLNNSDSESEEESLQRNTNNKMKWEITPIRALVSNKKIKLFTL